MPKDFSRNRSQAGSKGFNNIYEFIFSLQCLLRRIAETGLWQLVDQNQRAQKTVRLLAVPPLARRGDIEELYLRIEEGVQQHGPPQLMPFCEYVRDTFVVGYGPNALSVFGSKRRNQNALENLHRQLADRVGQARPNLWKLIRKYPPSQQELLD